MSLPAIDCVRRGVLNLRANWELAVAHLVGGFLVAAITLLGLLPPVAVVGFSLVRSFANPKNALAAADEAATKIGGLLVPFILAVLAMLVIWTAAFLLYCYVQAGSFGVLVAGDRQAPAGEQRDFRLFRTFSWPDFFGWGRRYMWRFFWFLNLYMAVLTAVAGGFILLVALAVAGGQYWGAPAALGIGCGGMLPLLFLALVVVLWAQLAQVDLVEDGTGTAVAMRRGLQVLGHRLGGVLLLFLIMLASSVAIGMVVAPFSLGFAVIDNLALEVVARLLLTALEWSAGAVIGIGFAAALVALMRAEPRPGIAA